MAVKSDIIVSHCQAVFKITDKIKSMRLEICHIDYFKRPWCLELSSCNREHMVHKAKNISYLPLH